MAFDELLAQVIELLQREKRVSYRSLERRYDLNDEYLEDIKMEKEHGSVSGRRGRSQTLANAGAD